jgi:hypothetical protein
MEINKKQKRKLLILAGFFFLIIILLIVNYIGSTDATYQKENKEVAEVKESVEVLPATVLPLDKELYDLKLEEMANNPIPIVPKPTIKKVKDPKTGKITEVTVPAPVVVAKPNIWPVKTVYPNAGAILPFNRIIAYYGNLYSTKMGVLGQYPEKEMLSRLDVEVKKWELADPKTPVVPALHYIAVVAQGSAGKDGKYRARMPDSEIDKVIEIAKKIDAIVFLDIQVGFSNLQTEVPLLEKYLKMPQVHLGVDPEFSMKSGIRPGKVVGTLDASDINFTTDYLAKIVKENNLTPKILIVHRYTQKMFTNYSKVKILPEVQTIIHMDGWGGKAKKIGTYKNYIYPEPVQFTGFKLFYKNDILDKGTSIFSPEELMKLNPRPMYIQYQ